MYVEKLSVFESNLGCKEKVTKMSRKSFSSQGKIIQSNQLQKNGIQNTKMDKYLLCALIRIEYNEIKSKVEASDALI